MRLTTSVALSGATAGGGGSGLKAAGEPPQPSRMTARAIASAMTRSMASAVTLRRWLYARLDSTGLRTRCSIGKGSGFMVHAAKDKLCGLYLRCFEVVTPNCAERVLLDIH